MSNRHLLVFNTHNKLKSLFMMPGGVISAEGGDDPDVSSQSQGYVEENWQSVKTFPVMTVQVKGPQKCELPESSVETVTPCSLNTCALNYCTCATTLHQWFNVRSKPNAAHRNFRTTSEEGWLKSIFAQLSSDLGGRVGKIMKESHLYFFYVTPLLLINLNQSLLAWGSSNSFQVSYKWKFVILNLFLLSEGENPFIITHISRWKTNIEERGVFIHNWLLKLKKNNSTFICINLGK